MQYFYKKIIIRISDFDYVLVDNNSVNNYIKQKSDNKQLWQTSLEILKGSNISSFNFCLRCLLAAEAKLLCLTKWQYIEDKFQYFVYAPTTIETTYKTLSIEWPEPYL